MTVYEEASQQVQPGFDNKIRAAIVNVTYYMDQIRALKTYASYNHLAYPDI